MYSIQLVSLSFFLFCEIICLSNIYKTLSVCQVESQRDKEDENGSRLAKHSAFVREIISCLPGPMLYVKCENQDRQGSHERMEKRGGLLRLRTGLVTRTMETAGSVYQALMDQLCRKHLLCLEEGLFSVLTPPLRSYVTLDK